MTAIPLRLNGQEAYALDSSEILLNWIRRDGGCTGVKEGCAEGDCGACSVLMSPPEGGQFRPVNSCLLMVGQAAGHDIITVEGLGNRLRPHPLQAEIASTGGSQCGYCTPGFVVAGAALLDRTANPSTDDIHDALAGNLCRCTGYRPIVSAIEAAALSAEPLPKASPAVSREDFGAILHPRSIRDATRMAADPKARLLAGGTDLILELRHGRPPPSRLISLRRVPELRRIEWTRDKMIIGGACPIEDMLPDIETRWPSFALVLRRFGSPQIRSLATLGGNLATASPIGDAAPCLLALDATLQIIGPIRRRNIPISEFLTGYRTSVLRTAEIIAEIHIPLRSSNSEFRAWKVSKRYDQDISTVAAAFRIDRDLGGRIVDARAAFGGMWDRPFRAPRVEAAMAEGNFAAAAEAISEDTRPISDVRGSAKYRILAAAGLLRRFELDLQGESRLHVADL